MKTQRLTENQTETAGEILRNGGIVAIPTETVYGLAANALDEEAVLKIFEAKGRPQDNPLIVHISDFNKLYDLVKYVPDTAKALAAAFWPGPLTMIMERADIVPKSTSAGLSTVAIRMPSDETARKIIDAAGVPLAAPSANLSGKPSPTTAQHVLFDMDGKIDAVVMGKECSVGVESTVITLCTNPPRLLRPGKITPEEIEKVIGKIDIDDAVLGKLKEGEKASSPGMKYKHYSPKAEVTIVKGSFDGFLKLIKTKNPNETTAIVFSGEEKDMPCKCLVLGDEDDSESQAHNLFLLLRECDELGAKEVYVRCPKQSGVGLAVMNRLLRAAAFRITEV